MDGIGGTLKRTADSLVSYGKNISSVEEFLKELKVACPKTSLTEITEDNFQEIAPLCNLNISPIPQVTLMHQAAWDSSFPDTIYPRTLSCLVCHGICNHFKLDNGLSLIHISEPTRPY